MDESFLPPPRLFLGFFGGRAGGGWKMHARKPRQRDGGVRRREREFNMHKREEMERERVVCVCGEEAA